MAKTLEELVGKSVLVGITHVDKQGRVLGNSQYAGVVIRANTQEGVIIKRVGTEDFKALPPFPEQYLPGQKATYTLKSNGMKVKNPDFVCTWRLTTSTTDF